MHSIGSFRDSLKTYFTCRLATGNENGNIYDLVYKTFGGVVSAYRQDPKYNKNESLILQRLVQRVQEVRYDQETKANQRRGLLDLAINAAAYSMRSQDFKTICEAGSDNWYAILGTVGSVKLCGGHVVKCLGKPVYAKSKDGGAVTKVEDKYAFTGERQKDKRMKKVQKLILVDGTDLGG